ncbi:MAG TPA: ParB/RepB/Spo0J family partition protein [Pseudonocardiaceae bacterium]|nr:ParB/RepB/Spo0J family partition protein [Pseudonocardiaceae bacterium]
MRSLPMSQVRVSLQQSRTRDVTKDLDELVDSIRVQGQLEPVIVLPSGDDDGTYEIIAGQRRWLALRQLAAATIHAVVLDRVDDITAQAISVTENLVRRDLSDRDLIDVCTRLHRRYGSAKAVAEELGLPYGKVRNYVRFERLRDGLRDLVQEERLDIATALRLEDHFGSRQVARDELRRMADALHGMTKVQRADYVAALRTGSRAGQPARDPRSVRQILVTLRDDEVEQLRCWARERNLTQDAAAAGVLRAFLRARATQAAATTRPAVRNGALEGGRA